MLERHMNLVLTRMLYMLHCPAGWHNDLGVRAPLLTSFPNGNFVVFIQFLDYFVR